MKLNKIQTLLAILTLFLQACTFNVELNKSLNNKEEETKKIANLLDSLNTAAANADFERYFNYYAEDAIFMGTDATEHWDKKAFMDFSKPFFDRKRAWNFKSIDRHIYFDNCTELAWFDELLETQMKICRGSGVVVKDNKEWKIKQYVLSITIPNLLSDSIVTIKSALEDSIIHKIKMH
ncbi:MAG: nuclear transport factor 2 family protein [Saprospiraceae bacterium]